MYTCDGSDTWYETVETEVAGLGDTASVLDGLECSVTDVEDVRSPSALTFKIHASEDPLLIPSNIPVFDWEDPASTNPLS